MLALSGRPRGGIFPAMQTRRAQPKLNDRLEAARLDRASAASGHTGMGTRACAGHRAGSRNGTGMGDPAAAAHGAGVGDRAGVTRGAGEGNRLGTATARDAGHGGGACDAAGTGQGAGTGKSCDAGHGAQGAGGHTEARGDAAAGQAAGHGRGTATGQVCAWPGCGAEGRFRAPRSRDRLRDFVWYCLEHVREYNSGWNYFAGMSREEIEAHQRADSTWHRPSWRFGVGAAGDPRQWRDPFGFFADAEWGEAEWQRAGRRGERQGASEASGRAARMMAVLDLPAGFTLAELKQRYKALVKKHHPDLHGGDRQSEEMLKRINEAYTYLKENRCFT